MQHAGATTRYFPARCDFDLRDTPYLQPVEKLAILRVAGRGTYFSLMRSGNLNATRFSTRMSRTGAIARVTLKARVRRE